MTETPTPSLLQDWLCEKANAPYFAAYRGDLLSIAHALDSLHSALTAERSAREKAEAEAERLREDAARLDFYAAHPHRIGFATGRHGTVDVWWARADGYVTAAPSLRAAIDAARKERP